MKTIGLLGGMSWESTASYYTMLNEGIKNSLGGLHSASIAMASVDFAPIEQMQQKGQWQEAGKVLAKHAQEIQNAGANCLLLCTNTMHKVAHQIQESIDIPFIHIADACAEALHVKHKQHTLLLGTRFTMMEDFYKDIISKRGIRVYTPNENDMHEIDRIIFEELVLGKIDPNSKKTYLEIIKRVSKEYPKIDSIILGCTEIGLLITQKDTDLDIFDTTAIHVQSALNFALGNTNNHK